MKQTRRETLKTIGLGSLACALSPQAMGAEKQGPNVIVILADDMGYSDLGCYGGEINTPNLDGLASKGVKFTQFYNAARCCPTRASLLTGLYPQQAGVGQMDSDLGRPEYQGYINEQSVTMAEVLKSAGYKTYLSGKWHVGREKGNWPLDRGFDRYYGLINGASNFFNNINYRDPSTNQTYLLDEEPYEIRPTSEEMWKRNEGFYMTDAFTDYAIQFLQEHQKEEPFFLYLPYTCPHWPLHAFPEDIEKYKGRFSAGWDKLREERFERQKQMGMFREDLHMAPLDDKVTSWEEADQETRDEFELEMEIYAAMIDRMDQNIGRVIKQLKQMGVYENTLILFLSDNGGCHTTPEFPHFDGIPGGPNSFPCYGYMGAELSNVPFRKYKQFIHEGGIATPLIAHYPQGIAAGQMCEQVGHIIDLMPTLVDYCGAEYPQTYHGNEITPAKGISLRKAFEGDTLSRETPLYWEHVRNRGVRVGNWKLVAAKPDLEWELYHLKEDRTELNDLSALYPKKKKELIAIYEEWAKENHVRPFMREKKQ